MFSKLYLFRPFSQFSCTFWMEWQFMVVRWSLMMMMCSIYWMGSVQQLQQQQQQVQQQLLLLLPLLLLLFVSLSSWTDDFLLLWKFLRRSVYKNFEYGLTWQLLLIYLIGFIQLLLSTLWYITIMLCFIYFYSHDVLAQR